MKNILFICIRTEVGEMYLPDLYTIFHDYANISFFSLENKDSILFSPSLLDNIDLVLSTSSDIYTVIQNNAVRHIPIIHLDFTFPINNLNVLKSFPINTNAYVGFFSQALSQVVISILYRFGLDNLNLHVYDKNDKKNLNITDKDVAIVGDASNIFPPEVKNIVSIGRRKIALSTLIDISASLSIICDDLKAKIDKYSEGNIIFDEGLNYYYYESSKAKTQLKTLEKTLHRELFKKGHIAKYEFSDILGESVSMRNSIKKAQKIAKIDKPTLITGESGTGKELFSQSIHNASPRKKFPFVAINCASIHPTLLESELFGYEEGSFTGAKRGGRAGLFEVANKGTIFLDEIGEISLETQAKLLRVLEQKEIMRVGSDQITSIDVRVIAATNKDLQKLVHTGFFRLDLFFRLNTIMFQIPPLRERPEDIIPLAYQFLEAENTGIDKISQEVLDFLLSYKWEGNVRELRNCVEYMAHIAEDIINISDLPDYMLKNIVSTDYKATRNIEYDATKAILHLLNSKSMGRRKLVNELCRQNIDISEYQLRNIVESLIGKGHIVLGKGRAGASLTVEGKKALDFM